MPAAKKPVAKIEKLETETINEETSMVSNDNIQKRHYIQVYLERLPHDELVGVLFYSDKTGKIEIESLDSRYASQIENLIEGDLLLKNGKFISIAENPKEWVLQAENATLGFNLFAKFFMESIEIAEEIE
tara:strand:+ start:273 stop:662 length:390 start_codon:yes stop_codon:yes gene_type:complete